MVQNTKHEIIMPLLLVFPMVSHWLLPAGVEQQLIMGGGVFSFYLPNICYLIYVLLYRFHGPGVEVYSNKRLVPKVKSILFMMTLYALINLFIQDANHIFLAFTCCLNWIYGTYLFIRFPMTLTQIENTKYIIVPSLVILSLEIILFSTGVFQYSSTEGNDIAGHEYSGIYRVSTTVGAATGTGVVIAILGMISTSKYTLNKYCRLLLFLMTTVAIFYTISRGCIITWIMYVSYYSFYTLRHLKIYRKLQFVLLACIIVFSLNKYDVFAPVFERTQTLSSDDNLDSGREERTEQAFFIGQSSMYMGVGAGQVFPDKTVSMYIQTPYRMAPHNFYMVLFSENGLIAVFSIILLLLTMLKGQKYSDPAVVGFILMILINFNTEGCIANAEFWALVMFFYAVIANRDESTFYYTT